MAALAWCGQAAAQDPPEQRIHQVLSIVGDGDGHPSYKNDTWLGVTGPDGAYTTIDAIAFEGGKSAYPGLQLELYGCHKSAFCAVGGDKIVGAVSGDAFDGKGDPTDASMLFRTTEPQTPKHNGMDVELWYTPNGSTAFTLGAALSPQGRGGFVIGHPGGGDLGPGSLDAQGDVAVGEHLRSTGASPTLAGCGRAKLETATDVRGRIANGEAISACTVRFARAYPAGRAPVCVAQDFGGPGPEPYLARTDETGMTVRWSSAYAGRWVYVCMG